MQDRYAGDIGDYVKLALLRAIAPGRRLGIAWYLYPDEEHNTDGRHTNYLSDPDRWRTLDPGLFDGLCEVLAEERSVARLIGAGFVKATHSTEVMKFGDAPASQRDGLRARWFDRALALLNECDVVFADPDNGLTDDSPERRRQKRFAKSMPLSEAVRLADRRMAVIYHHNTRFAGGHDAEIEHWRAQLGSDTIAIRANAYSCRTFFVLNPTLEARDRIADFCERWRHHRVFST